MLRPALLVPKLLNPPRPGHQPHISTPRAADSTGKPCQAVNMPPHRPGLEHRQDDCTCRTRLTASCTTPGCPSLRTQQQLQASHKSPYRAIARTRNDTSELGSCCAAASGFNLEFWERFLFWAPWVAPGLASRLLKGAGSASPLGSRE